RSSGDDSAADEEAVLLRQRGEKRLRLPRFGLGDLCDVHRESRGEHFGKRDERALGKLRPRDEGAHLLVIGLLAFPDDVQLDSGNDHGPPFTIAWSPRTRRPIPSAAVSFSSAPTAT